MKFNEVKWDLTVAKALLTLSLITSMIMPLAHAEGTRGGGNDMKATPVDRVKIAELVVNLRTPLRYVFNYLEQSTWSGETYDSTLKKYVKQPDTIHKKLFAPKTGLNIYQVLERVKFVVHFDRQCLDKNGVPQDASPLNSDPLEICFDGNRLLKQENYETAYSHILALGAHEASHKTGLMDVDTPGAITETEANFIQSDVQGASPKSYGIEKYWAQILKTMDEANLNSAQIIAELVARKDQNKALLCKAIDDLMDGVEGVDERFSESGQVDMLVLKQAVFNKTLLSDALKVRTIEGFCLPSTPIPAIGGKKSNGTFRDSYSKYFEGASLTTLQVYGINVLGGPTRHPPSLRQEIIRNVPEGDYATLGLEINELVADLQHSLSLLTAVDKQAQDEEKAIIPLLAKASAAAHDANQIAFKAESEEAMIADRQRQSRTDYEVSARLMAQMKANALKYDLQTVKVKHFDVTDMKSEKINSLAFGAWLRDRFYGNFLEVTDVHPDFMLNLAHAYQNSKRWDPVTYLFAQFIVKTRGSGETFTAQCTLVQSKANHTINFIKYDGEHFREQCQWWDSHGKVAPQMDFMTKFEEYQYE